MKSTFTLSPVTGSLSRKKAFGRQFRRMILAVLLMASFGQAAQAQYCTTGLYTSGCAASDYVNSFSTTGGSTNITNNNSGCASGALGYSNYTTMAHTGVQGTTVNWSYTNCPGYTEVYAIFVDWNQNGILNDAGEVMFAQTTGTPPGSTVTGSFVIPITATPGATRIRIRCAYYPVTIPVTPCGNEYYGEAEDYTMNVIASIPCSGTPNAGTTVANPTIVCPNNTSTLSLSGASLNSGITYQWQELLGTNWSSIPGAVNSFYTTPPLTASGTYRAQVICNGNLSSYSVPATVNVGSFYYCYCPSAPSSSYGAYSDIGNVTIKKQPNNVVILNNGVATPLINNPAATGFYTNYALTVPAIPIFRDSLYRMSVTQISQNSFLVSTVASYIDYNRDGTFQPTERMFYKVTASATQEVNDTFRVPSNTGLGLTGMRVIIEYGTNVAINPCGLYNTYGETEDYLVNVNFPPCTGPANPGTAYISDTSSCPGYTVDLGDTTYEKLRSFLQRTWQYSLNGGAYWTDVPGSTDKDTISNQVITAPVRYRLRMLCQATGDTSYSNQVSVSIKQPYQCYPVSLSMGGNDDSSDIGAFQIGSNVFNTGGPHLNNPQAFRKRTDNTSVPAMILYADSTYKLALYHIMRGNTHADARVSVFMDFNNNLRYDALGQTYPFPDELVFSGVTSAGNWYLDSAVTIPSVLIPNTPTGLRVILNNDVNPAAPANMIGSGTYGSGETEDYVVLFRRGSAAGITTTGNLRDMVVYPNPTEGRFTVLVNAQQSLHQVEVTVTNLTGQAVLARSFTASGNQFTADMDLSGQARGIYFVAIQADGEKVMTKLIIR